VFGSRLRGAAQRTVGREESGSCARCCRSCPRTPPCARCDVVGGFRRSEAFAEEKREAECVVVYSKKASEAEAQARTKKPAAAGSSEGTGAIPLWSGRPHRSASGRKRQREKHHPRATPYHAVSAVGTSSSHPF